MQKIFSKLIILFVIFGLTACKVKEEHGNSFKFALDSNSSTGYNWKYELSKENIVDVSYEYDNKDCGNMDGCTGQNVYTVTALNPGKVTLTLTYSFVNPDKYPKNKKTAIYEITVNDDLSITEKHYGSYY